MIFFLRAFALIVLLIGVSRCANIRPPTGGPQDEDPPILTSAIPNDRQTNYRGQRIYLEFNEEIKVENLKRSLLITPYTDVAFEQKQRRNWLELTFEEPFPANTTVTLIFSETVKDLTEGNPARDLRLTFSTGSFLDSIRVRGNVRQLLTHETEKDNLVLLYDAYDTTSVRNDKPLYIARTDSSGNFRLENIRDGFYRIYALKEKNSSLTFNNHEEMIAFNVDTLDLRTDQDSVQLFLQYNDFRPPRVVRQEVKPDFININFNKGLRHIEGQWLELDSLPLAVLSEKRDQWRVYDPAMVADSLRLRLTLEDSLGKTLTDTLSLRFAPRELPDTVTVNPRLLSFPEKTVGPNLRIQAVFSDPVRIRPNAFTLQLDSVTFQPLPTDSVLLDTNRLGAELRLPAELPERFKLIVGAGSLTSALTETVAADTVAFSRQASKKGGSGGSLSGTLDMAHDDFVLELLTERFETVRSLRGQRKFLFEGVPAGKYRLRLKVDLNQDGVWSPGNFERGIPPEPVLFYSGLIEVRDNWEIQDIDFQTGY